MTEEEFNDLEEDIYHYNETVTTKIQQGKMSQAERDKLIGQHRVTMETFYSRLEIERQRMERILGKKLAARRMRRDEEEEDVTDEDEDSEDDDSEDEV